MSSKSFSFSEVLGFGWRVMKSNFWFFAGVSAVLLLISLSGQILGQIMERHPKAIAPFWFFALLGVSFIVQTILGIGLIKITLSFCDDQKPRFSTLFNGFDCFWRYLGTGLLYGLIIGGVSTACVLPSVLLSTVMHNPCLILPVLLAVLVLVVILSIKFSLCFYFVVDKDLGPINALRASSRATKGAIWSLFVFGILCGLINLLGTLCFIVGLFATLPIVMVAMVLVYRQLSKQTPELAGLGITGPNTKPGTITGGPHNTSGIQLAPAIQAVVNARPDQNIQSRVGAKPGAGTQLSTATQSGHGNQHEQGVQPTADIRREGEKKTDKSFFFWLAVLIILIVALAVGIVHRLWPSSEDNAAVFPNKVAAALKKAVVASKKTTVTSKKVTVAPKEVTAAHKEAAAAPKGGISLTGILYSEDNPLAIINGSIVKEGDIINGTKVVKIHKDGVELEKDGKRWTQRTK